MKRFPIINYIKALPRHKYRTEIKRYLLLLLIPLLLLTVLYFNVNQVITQQMEEYAELTVNQFYTQSSSMLHEMKLVSSAVLRDSEIVNVLQDENADVMNSLHICDTIRNYLVDSSYVQHAYLVCEKSGKIYSEQGLYSGASLPAILSNIGATDTELSGASSEGNFHVLNETRMAPYCIVPAQDGDGNTVGYLIVTLRMTEFLRFFYGMDAELCAIFNDDAYISSYISNIGIESFDWRDEASVSALLERDVTCVYLEQEDYTYVVAVSKESYNRPLHIILKWFFIYAIAALVIGYFYLYYVSKQRYLRISAMIDALPVSYQGDHSYEQVYDSIRTSLEEFRTQREYLQVEKQGHMLHTLLISDHEQTVTAEQFQDAGVNPGGGVFYVATFFITKISDPMLEKGYSTVDFLRLLFRSTISELAERYNTSCAFCQDHKGGVAVLYGSDGAALQETVLELSKNVIEILTSSYDINIQATVSSPVLSVLELPGAYQETQSLHRFAKSINSNAPIIAQEDLQRSSGILLNGDFIRQEQILINTILARKYDVIPSMVESILSTHVSPPGKNYTLAQSRLLSVSNVLVEGVRTASIPGIPAEEYARRISQADSVYQLAAAAGEVYGLMAQQCRESTDERDIVTIACNYIAQNLSDRNLSVSVVCEAAGVSVQRLTRMFQSQFNMAVAEYINACRIKRAKELLPDKQLTVAQIAAQVGYSNTDTFTRNFKKIEGITATEYRKTLCEG